MNRTTTLHGRHAREAKSGLVHTIFWNRIVALILKFVWTGLLWRLTSFEWKAESCKKYIYMRFQKYRDSSGQGLNLTRPYSSRGFAGLTKTTSNRGMKYSCGDKSRSYAGFLGSLLLRNMDHGLLRAFCGFTCQMRKAYIPCLGLCSERFRVVSEQRNNSILRSKRSVRFRSKEREKRVNDRAKNGAS